jgi:hypothetical protein
MVESEPFTSTWMDGCLPVASLLIIRVGSTTATSTSPESSNPATSRGSCGSATRSNVSVASRLARTCRPRGAFTGSTTASFR